MSLILADDWADLPVRYVKACRAAAIRRALLELLVTENLLTAVSGDRLGSGKFAGLILGNYRVLDRIGSGAMGIVYKGEHIRMRHIVAIKVLAFDADQNPLLLARFYAEMRAVARLHHPNIVAAIDAGDTRGEAGRADPALLRHGICRRARTWKNTCREHGPCRPPEPARSFTRSPRPWRKPTSTTSFTATSSRRTSC